MFIISPTNSTLARLSLVLCWGAVAALFAGLAHAGHVVRAAVPPGAIKQVMVINLENESLKETFGADSPAVYLNSTLLAQGVLIQNYFATSHASLGNYLSEVSGQASTPSQNNDCLNLDSIKNRPLLGGFIDVLPGTDADDPAKFPGQVLGDGCVFPAPSDKSRGVRTIGDQLDDKFGIRRGLNWREYAEDMGNDAARDYGEPDPLGGTDCAHPPIGGIDHSNDASPKDQYATRHTPFVYFHSIIDDAKRCAQHVVPLGTLTVGRDGKPDLFQGHLYRDLRHSATTPKYLFVTPNLCSDGHDATCAAPNIEGIMTAAETNAGGLVSADLWLKHWIPMIFSSPAYRSGEMLVVLTFDEADGTDSRACEKADQAECRSLIGPNNDNPGYAPVIALFRPETKPPAPNTYLGGGQIGAVLFNKRFIKPGTVSRGSYNHFSALRSYEDIFGITEGGDDGLGHLGFAAAPGLRPFGPDVFNRR